MKFPAYQISQNKNGTITVSHVVLDETELTPESKWMEGYLNNCPEEGLWQGRSLESTLENIRTLLGLTVE